MVGLHRRSHRRREVEVGGEDEVDHRDGHRAPCLIVAHRNAPLAISLENAAQVAGERHAGTTFVARRREDGIQEAARKCCVRRLLRELVSVEGWRMVNEGGHAGSSEGTYRSSRM
jgi:hypothetical protein